MTPSSVRATEAVRGALGASLAGREWALPAGVPADDFLAAAARHRAFPLLAVGALEVPDAVAERVATEDATQRINCLRLTGEVLRAWTILDGAGVRALAFKGPALAVVAYGDFTLRGFGDIDLLVAPIDVSRAWSALTEAGWAPDPAWPTPGPAWGWRHVLATYYELALTAPTSSIDLHWAPMPTRSGFPDFDGLWGARQMVSLAGAEVPTLSAFDSFAHSASHAAKDDWSWLRSLADVHRLASDPAVWASARRLNSAQRLSLGIALRSFGPVSPEPPGRARALAAANRHWSHVEERQAGVSTHDAVPGRMPGVGMLQHIQRGVRGSRSPVDAFRVTAVAVVPGFELGDLPARTFLGALPTILQRRWKRAAMKWRAWRRR